MRIVSIGRSSRWILLGSLLGFTTACTSYNPTTGQNEIDYGATAGVAGAALGAAALGVALSNNDDDDRYYYGGPGYYGGPRYSGGGSYNRGSHNTVNVDRNVNINHEKTNVRNREADVRNRQTDLKNRKVNAINRKDQSARPAMQNRGNRSVQRPSGGQHRTGSRPSRKR